MEAKLVYMMRELFNSNQFLFWLILPTVVISYIAYKMAEEKKINTNVLLIIISAFSPILGLICYIARRDADKDASNVYLGCAAASFVVFFLMFVFL